MSTPPTPQSPSAMSVFIPRSVAAYESAADRWHGRFFAPTQALTQRALGFAERLMSGWLGSFHLGWNQPVAQRTTVPPQPMNVVRPWYDQPAPAASRPMARPFASTASSSSSSYATTAAAPMSSVTPYEEMVTLTLPPEALLASAAISTSAEAPAAAPIERRVREFFPEVVRPVAPVLSTAQREAIAVARAAAITSVVPATGPSAPPASAFETPNRELLASAYAAEAAATAAYTPALTMVYQPAPAARALYHLAWADSQLARSSAAGAPQVAATMAPQLASTLTASPFEAPTASPAPAALASSASFAAAMRTALPVETAARMVVRDGFVYLAPPAPAAAPARPSMAAPSAAPSYAAQAMSSAPSFAPSFAAALPSSLSTGSVASAPLQPSPAAIAAAASLASFASPAALWQSTIAPATSFAASLPAMATSSIGAASNVALGASLVVAPTAMQQSIGAFLAQRLSTQTLADVGAGPTPQALARLTQTPSPEMIVLQSPAIAAASRGAAPASSALPSALPMTSSPSAPTAPSFTPAAVLSGFAASAAPSFAAPVVSGAASFGPAVEQLLATYAEAQAATVAPRFRPGHLGVQIDAQVQSIVSHLATSWGHAPAAPAELTTAASRWAPSPSFSYVAPAAPAQPSVGVASMARGFEAPVVGGAATTPSFAPSSQLPRAAPAVSSAFAPWAAPIAVQPLGLPSFVEWFMPPALEPSAAAASPRSFAGPTAATMSLPFLAPATSMPAASAATPAASRGFAPSSASSPYTSTLASPSALAPMWASLDAASLGPAAILSFVEQMPALATLRALQPTQLAALAFAAPDVAAFQDPAVAATAAHSARAVDAPAMPSLQAWSGPALEALSPQQRATVIAQLASSEGRAAFAPSLAATTFAPSQPFAPAATRSFTAAPDFAPPGAAAVRSEALAAAVALRSSNLASDFVDPVVLTLLQREGFMMPTVAPAGGASSVARPAGIATAMPSMTMVAASPLSAPSPWQASSLSQAPAPSPASFAPSASPWGFQPSLLPTTSFSFETIAAAAPELLGAAPSASRSRGAMAPLEWTLLSVFPSASTAAELGLTSARTALPSRASVAPVVPSSHAVPSFASSSGSAPSFASELVAPFLGSAPTSGAPISARGPAWAAPAESSFDAASAVATRAPILSALDMVRGPDVLRLPSGAQPRGGFLWPSATSHATAGHTSLIQPEMFTDTAVQAQLVAISGRSLDAPQPLWEMLRAPAGAAPMGTGGAQAQRSFDASGTPFVQDGSALGGPEAPSRRVMGELPTLSAAATQAAPRYLPSSESERLQPVLDLLRGAPSAPSNETGGEAPQSIRYERAMPIIAAQPSSEAAASIMQAVRAVGPSSPSDDRLTLADLTMITMATATMNFAASDEGGAPAAPAGGGGGGGGGGGAAAAGGGAAGGDAGPQVEELALKVYEAYLRLIEIQRERSGESWES